ncbi:MAG: A24 family peptidase [Candidatus Nanoarchaeia archaeon]|nr:A24 family peptidase [Candidatus Nanoarchaeia archaeon]
MLFLFNAIALISLIFASLTDIKTREVPDWLNYGLIIFGLFSRLIYSFVLSDFSFFFYGLAGFFVFFIIGNLMFYSAQWGGGDSKLLMGLGALIGLNPNFTEIPFIFMFFINIMIVGAFYGLFWSFLLAIKNWKKFSRDFTIRLKEKTRIRAIVIILCLLILSSSFFINKNFLRMMVVSLAVFTFLIFYLSLFIKSIEKTCMLKYVNPEQLTEGDWIAKDVIVNKKRIAGPKDLGIEKKQINKLIEFKRKGLVKKILIKEGIPFVPSFLIAYILTLFVGNWVFLFI